MSRKIYCIGAPNDYPNWMQGELIDNMEDADLVLFTGGDDVSPNYYFAEKHPKTYNNPERDKIEEKAFMKAKRLGKHMIGICRGSQFGCVMSGGELIQHQDNPLYIHNIETFDGKVIPITSSHHQAQYPYNLKPNEYEILAWTKGISAFHEDGSLCELHLPEGKEIEIAFYRKTKFLAIQGHPEWMYTKNPKSETIQYLQELLDDFMGNELDDYIDIILQYATRK